MTNNKFSNFLGNHPEYNSFDELISNYIYAHEFVWVNFGYNISYDELKEILTNKYNDNYFKKEISLDKVWSLLNLIVLKDSAQLNDYSFCVKTVDVLLKRQGQLTAQELNDYASMVSYTFYREFSAFPLVAPSLNIEYCASILDIMPSFKKVSLMVNDVAEVFKDYRDIKPVELGSLKLIMDNYKFDLGLVSKHKYYAEFFISYISSVVISYNESYPNEDLYDIYTSLTTRFVEHVISYTNDDLLRKLLDLGEKHLNN